MLRQGRTMKTNKEIIYDFIKSFDFLERGQGLTTFEISEKLDLQRSNVSAVLNTLVSEGFLDKTSTRPVLYFIKKRTPSINDHGSFKNLIGANGSMKSAIELAKAAILYPMGSLNCAILGSKGVGTSYFVQLMFLYAVENKVQRSNQAMVRFNCRNYLNEPEEMVRQLFGEQKDGFMNIMDQSNGGFLFIDHVEALSANGRRLLISVLEEKKYAVLETQEILTLDITIILGMDSHVHNVDDILSKLTIVMRLDDLSDRSLKERLDLVNHFFTLESLQTKKIFQINHEVMVCLLLYRCSGNVKQLRNDIRAACAHAYVREHGVQHDVIQIYLSDFDRAVREGFLEYKRKREALSLIIPVQKNYRYEGNDIKRTESVQFELRDHTLYDHLDTKIQALRVDGLQQGEINGILSADISEIMREYTYGFDKQMDTQQLRKIVSFEIIEGVEAFLSEASIRFGSNYDDRIFYGLRELKE